MNNDLWKILLENVITIFNKYLMLLCIVVLFRLIPLLVRQLGINYKILIDIVSTI